MEHSNILALRLINLFGSFWNLQMSLKSIGGGASAGCLSPLNSTVVVGFSVPHERYVKPAFCRKPIGGWRRWDATELAPLWQRTPMYPDVKKHRLRIRALAEGQDPPESIGLFCKFQKEPLI
jgi:hypothetical protein